MSARLVIIVWAATPERPALAAAPFVYALTARALDVDVEMHFTGPAVRWLFDGIAAAAFTDRAQTKTVAQFIAEAHAAGVRLLACAMALAEHQHGATLITEVDGVAGAATVVELTLSAEARTLVF